MDYKNNKPIQVKSIKIQQEYLDPRDYKAQHLQDFLKKISMLESSGGLDTDHNRIPAGIQAGDKAVGDYGLMPNTLVELSKRYPSETTEDLNKEDLKSKAINDPEFEQTMAATMADYLKNKRGLTDDQAAAAWEAGHNTPVEKLNLDTPRARKFKVLGN